MDHLLKQAPVHGTNKAIMLGLMDYDPSTIDCSKIDDYINQVKDNGKMKIYGNHEIAFDPSNNIVFKTQEQLSFHSNALKVFIAHGTNEIYEDIFYSIGGGFVVKGPAEEGDHFTRLPYPINEAEDLLKWCVEESCPISHIVKKK